MKKTLAIAFLSCIMLSSCDLSTFIAEISELVTSKVTSKHEYKDSDKWGLVTEKEIDCKEFDKILSTGVVRIVFKQDSIFSLKVRGNEKAIDEYEIKTGSGKLSAKIRKKGLIAVTDNTTPAITLYVTAPELEYISAEGSSTIEIRNDLVQAGSLRVRAEGSSSLKTRNMHVSELDIKADGASFIYMKDINVEQKAEVEINGSGKLESAFTCQKLEIELNGASTARLDVDCDVLDVECNGASSVTLDGRCRTMKKGRGGTSNVNTNALDIEEK